MENELLLHTNQESRMTSLQIAEIIGKNHRDVLRAIRNMEPAWVKVGERKFAQSSYINSQNKEQPCYSLTQEECLYIATKFNDEARARLIKRWKELEIEKRNNMPSIPQTFSQALMLAAKQQEEIEQKQKLLEVQTVQIAELNQAVAEMSDKVSYVDRILSSKSTCLVTSIAQDYGMSAKKFNKVLNALEIQRKVEGQWILYSKYLALGYVHSKAIEIATSHGVEIKYNTEWTQKGRLFLYNILKDNGYLPLIEQYV